MFGEEGPEKFLPWPHSLALAMEVSQALPPQNLFQPLFSTRSKFTKIDQQHEDNYLYPIALFTGWGTQVNCNYSATVTFMFLR